MLPDEQREAQSRQFAATDCGREAVSDRKSLLAAPKIGVIALLLHDYYMILPEKKAVTQIFCIFAPQLAYFVIL